MTIIHHIIDKITPYQYDPHQDQSVLDRRDIAERTDRLVKRFETEPHPATGMTLADMAANRRRGRHPWTTEFK